jgi:hypothetical protein
VRPTRYDNPQALRQAVTDRLRNLARQRPGTQLNDLQRQFAYDRLLSRVFITDPDRWVLKGATAMLARLQGVARHTIDIDLRHLGDLHEAEEALRRAADQDLGDHFRFVLGTGRRLAEAGGALRIPVVAYLGVTTFAEFRVDLTAGLPIRGDPEEVPPLVPIDLPGIVRTRYRAYPVVDHIADKVCALFEVHERIDGPPEPSSRYRDLLDLVVFAHTEKIDGPSVATALRSEFARRRLAMPDRIVVPEGAGWPAGYARVARDAPVLGERDLNAALATVGRFVDPVLAGEASGRWDPNAMAWQEAVRRARD